MAITLYSYNKLCDSGRLTKEIEDSAIVTALDRIETVSSPAETKVYMKAALSGGDETALAALVTAHANAPLPENEAKLFTTGQKETATGREVFTLAAFSVNTDYEVKATGYRGTANAGVTTNLDFAIGAEDRYINGLALILKNHSAEDLIGLKIVDVDNVLGYGAGLILKTFGTSWNVDDSQQHQGKDSFNYAARIPAGVYVRVIYESTGGTNVLVKINFQLHKKTAS